jgi:hypothetical protein
MNDYDKLGRQLELWLLAVIGTYNAGNLSGEAFLGEVERVIGSAQAIAIRIDQQSTLNG